MKTFFRNVSCIATVATSALASTVTMPEFNIDLEHRDIEQLNKLATMNKSIAIGVDAFTENYRAYVWYRRNTGINLDAEQHNVVMYDNLRHYRTIYNFIPTEIARAVFDIKGGVVEYTNKGDSVLEYTKNGENDIKNYDQSKWNDILFVNVINTILNPSQCKILRFRDIFDRVHDHYSKKI